MAGDTNGKERYTCEDVITALDKTKGMVYLAAESLGCSHTTVYKYIDKYATVRQAKERAEGRIGDIVELKLINAINDDKPWAIQFYARTKLKHRGYVERQEHSGPDGEKLEPLVIIRADKVTSDSG